MTNLLSDRLQKEALGSLRKNVVLHTDTEFGDKGYLRADMVEIELNQIIAHTIKETLTAVEEELDKVIAEEYEKGLAPFLRRAFDRIREALTTLTSSNDRDI